MNVIKNILKSFHSKYNIGFDIIKLIENLKNEGKFVYDICKIFVDLIFTDGDSFINNLNNTENLSIEAENSFENPENENSNEKNEADNFLKEKNNLIEKLENINLEQDKNEEIDNNDIFEEFETLNEYDTVNYKNHKNNKISFIPKLDNNIIEDLYIFKRK